LQTRSTPLIYSKLGSFDLLEYIVQNISNFTTESCKDIGLRKLEFEAKTQLTPSDFFTNFKFWANHWSIYEK